MFRPEKSSRPRTTSGTRVQTREGSRADRTMAPALSWPPIHSMVVVTSPMGDQAPPALAAITTRPAKMSWSSARASSLRNREIITMVVVRLSSAADRKNVNRPISHSRVDCLRVLIRSVTTENPRCASISSTITMAPIRKNRISAISLRWWRSSVGTQSVACCAVPCTISFSGASSGPANASRVQHSTAVRMAVADLSTLIACSKAMHTYPSTNTSATAANIPAPLFFEKNADPTGPG